MKRRGRKTLKGDCPKDIQNWPGMWLINPATQEVEIKKLARPPSE